MNRQPGILAWRVPRIAVLFGFVVILIILIMTILMTTNSVANPTQPPFTLNVLKTGLGSGTVSSAAPGISCGIDCDEDYASVRAVELTASPAAGSVFDGWEGACAGVAISICTVTTNTDLAVRAAFTLPMSVPPITDFTAIGIRDYLSATSQVNTPALFIAALPPEFRQNWILMSRSESLQTGTAKSPRILLPSANAQFVFTVGMTRDSSYPGSHPNAIEYMQWDAATRNFRFHEIVLDDIPAIGTVITRTRGVSIDDAKCFKCHSTQNVYNRSPYTGTTGIPTGSVQFKSKPNWDAYDSWGGMLPFNRDRIYQGSAEAAAFRTIFNLWNWRNSAESDSVRQIIEQLALQPAHVGASSPHSIARNYNSITDFPHITFGFDALTPIPTTPISITYTFDRASAPASSVDRGGRYVTLRHSNPSPVPANDTYGSPGSDEGRGVQFFDLLGGMDGNLNPQRIAGEVISHTHATGSVPIDVRPIVLAISTGCVTNPDMLAAPGSAERTFFDARHGVNFATLATDTQQRRQSLPQRKADIQKINLDRSNDPYLIATLNGLLQEYSGTAIPSIATLRQEVFRRPIDLGERDTIIGGIYVDREKYSENNTITLFRYFLEPLGVSVDKWSMSVRGRSRTYTFADVFNAYISTINTIVGTDYLGRTAGGGDCTQLINDTVGQWNRLPAADAIPKFTDIQRIFNKNCIDCHGGLGYPPYVNFGTFLDFSENESPPAATPRTGNPRLERSYSMAMGYTTAVDLTAPDREAELQRSGLYRRITATNQRCAANFAGLTTVPQLMPCGGPAISQADVKTIARWIIGGRSYTVGDPHIKTIEGIYYDFQSAGEFVLLRGEGMEIQARQTAVGTEGTIGPDAYTGLTTCASVNTAFALRVGAHRVTYQPNLNGEPDPTGLQLRVDGKLIELNGGEFVLPLGGRILSSSAPGGIQIEYPGGSVVAITPHYWDYYQIWFLDIDARNVRVTDGVMGSIAPGNWLPALPDGSLMGPMPGDIPARYIALYENFADAWRVSDATTLFDYAPGTATETFTLDNWPKDAWAQEFVICTPPEQPENLPPLQTIALEEAEILCSDVIADDLRAHCAQDVMVTGEPTFAEAYLMTEQVGRNARPTAPLPGSPENNLLIRAQKDNPILVPFAWSASSDLDGDDLTYKHCLWSVNELFNFANCSAVSSTTPALEVELEPGRSYFWKIIAEDGKGGTTESEMRRISTTPVEVVELQIFIPFAAKR